MLQLQIWNIDDRIVRDKDHRRRPTAITTAKANAYYCASQCLENSPPDDRTLDDRTLYIRTLYVSWYR